jgi:hypothetical protein
MFHVQVASMLFQHEQAEREAKGRHERMLAELRKHDAHSARPAGKREAFWPRLARLRPSF